MLSRWYHYELSRHAAEALLLSNGKDGSYLLRNSNDGVGCFALSVRWVNPWLPRCHTDDSDCIWMELCCVFLLLCETVSSICFIAF